MISVSLNSDIYLLSVWALSLLLIGTKINWINKETLSGCISNMSVGVFAFSFIFCCLPSKKPLSTFNLFKYWPRSIHNYDRQKQGWPSIVSQSCFRFVRSLQGQPFQSIQNLRALFRGSIQRWVDVKAWPSIVIHICWRLVWGNEVKWYHSHVNETFPRHAAL